VGTATRIRLDDFLADPAIDERRLELIDGEVHAKPMPTWGHATLAGELYLSLRPFGFAGVEPRAVIGPTAAFDPSSLIPDVAFYRTAPPGRDEWMTRPPHVAVEILSPGQARRDLRAKIDLLVAFGVESVWLVDPSSRSVEVYEGGGRRILGEDDTLASSAVPGLAINLRELFDRAETEA
jgi:Uma2 family endonuclease